MSHCDRLLILGDFNIHLCYPTKPLVKEFLLLIDSMNLSQFVSSPSHNLGHTLDLVLSYGFPITNLRVIDAAFSDHLPIVFESVCVSITPTCSQPVSYSRFIQPLTASLFSEHYLANFADAASFDKLNTEEMLQVFTNSCSISIDSVAPLKPRKAKRNNISQPRLDANTRALRQEYRKAERKWKRDKLQVSYQCLKACLASYQKSVKEAKFEFLSKLITENVNRPRMLFKTFDLVLNPIPAPSLDPSRETSENFFFNCDNKVRDIRASIKPSIFDPPLSCSPTELLTCFHPISSVQLAGIVSKVKLSTCESDIIPAHLLKEVFATLSPAVTAIINNSLESGVVPASFKHAIVHPLLKKPHLDQSIFSNFRPISKLPFISKLLERAVYSQLDSYISMSNVLDTFQSGFRSLHRTAMTFCKFLTLVLMRYLFCWILVRHLTQLIIVFCYSDWKSGWVFRVPLCSGWPRILKIEPSQ